MEANIHKIGAFVATARLGSITRAARELGCTQSTASRMVSSLEEEWGVRLFERRGPQLSLTGEGERLLRAAREVIAACDGLDRCVRGIAELEVGSVDVAAPSSVVSQRLAGPLGRFVADHPRVEVNLYETTYDEAECMLRAGRADLSFVSTRLEGDGIVSTPFVRDEIVVVTPRGHFADAARSIPIRQLLDERFIADTETAPLLQRELTSPCIRCQTSDITAILALVEAGLGISLLPSLALERAERRVDVRHLEVPAYRTIYLAHCAHEGLAPAPAAFLGYLDGCAELPEAGRPSRRQVASM